MRKSNYDKMPATVVDGTLWKGWESIRKRLAEIHAETNGSQVWVVECYQGVHHEELMRELQALAPDRFINTRDLFKSAEDIEAMTYPYLTDDRLFGRRAHFSYTDFLDEEKVNACRESLRDGKGWTIVYGHAAAEIVSAPDKLIYADMARWEIQMRSRRKEVNGLGVENREEAPSYHYKRGYFIDWIVCDNLKKKVLPKVDYWLDTHIVRTPKMISGETLKEGLEKTAHTPFRVVPFFDPAPWGGQWMKEGCGLNPEKENYGWCFDCVPEENSLYFEVNGVRFELPSVDLVLLKSRELLGEPVEARFGKDFPIRFDFLDTVGGGNLSVQVHPTTQFIRENFGMYYTQDESYYLLDAKEGASVYLGLKTGIDKNEMIHDLREAQKGEVVFDTERYVNRLPAKKHDHYLIPGGTVHCSGSEALVLEISSTPNLFTFKLWDWQRLGLDGKPRPINVERGKDVIDWKRDTEYVNKHLANRFTQVAEGDGWREECTGLHPNEFIETHRHWFSKPVTHHTNNSVNVLNLVEGEEAVIESPINAFKPFVVHYAETFIIPASVGEYTIAPYGKSVGQECGTIKAYVRY